MFKRIIYDEWTTIVPLISFWFTFSVFLAITLRAYLLRPKTVEHLGQMPLRDDEHQNLAGADK
ncbi:MAG: hypothetical protein AAF065_00910 [Verrucomicrobiota bacterium]